jgi:hypothetical protein
VNIQIDSHESNNTFKLDEADNGWILRRGESGSWRRICWLPYKRRHRGIICACFGEKIVITAEGGLLTILDFSNV